MLIYVNLPEGNISVALWLFNIAKEAMAHFQMIFPFKPPFIMDFPMIVPFKPPFIMDFPWLC
jgi:hypothetical protein